MSKNNRKKAAEEIGAVFADMAKETACSLARLIGIILASGIAGTVVCLWYGAPLGFALLGGLLGIVLALVVLYAAADTF